MVRFEIRFQKYKTGLERFPSVKREFILNALFSKKSQIFIRLVLLPVRSNEFMDHSRNLRQGLQCKQGRIGGESVATCVNLIDQGFESSRPRQKATTFTTRPSGR